MNAGLYGSAASCTQPGSSFHLHFRQEIKFEDIPTAMDNAKDHDFRMSLATFWEPLATSLKKIRILTSEKYWEVEV